MTLASLQAVKRYVPGGKLYFVFINTTILLSPPFPEPRPPPTTNTSYYIFSLNVIVFFEFINFI
jgi:hypothetical protein